MNNKKTNKVSNAIVSDVIVVYYGKSCYWVKR